MYIEELFHAAKQLPVRILDNLFGLEIPANPENSREIATFTQQLQAQGFSAEFMYSNDFSPDLKFRGTDWRNDGTRKVGIFKRVTDNQYESVTIVFPKLDETRPLASQQYFSQVKVRFATTTDDGKPHLREVTFLDYLLQDPKACRLTVMAGPLGGRGTLRVTKPARRPQPTPV